MEKELNIAEILKDKPQGTKLYDLLYIDDLFPKEGGNHD